MKMIWKLMAVIGGVWAGSCLGFWTGSLGFGVVGGVSFFNMFVLMGMTTESY